MPKNWEIFTDICLATLQVIAKHKLDPDIDEKIESLLKKCRTSENSGHQNHPLSESTIGGHSQYDNSSSESAAELQNQQHSSMSAPTAAIQSLLDEHRLDDSKSFASDFLGSIPQEDVPSGSTLSNDVDVAEPEPLESILDSRAGSAESPIEYINGNTNVTYRVANNVKDIDARNVGWAMSVYGSHKNKSKSIYTCYKHCLGIYQCPQCSFTERPRIPRGCKTKGSPPMPPEKKCPTHSAELKHLSCGATLTIIHDLGSRELSVFHEGDHNHPRPHPIRTGIASETQIDFSGCQSKDMKEVTR
ncbi:hypothetical protein BGZ76_003338 [Entomortierella beljakovae]|nr:hypothetical protein BGZ76_003338 [Entomortierella beljakovae]